MQRKITLSQLELILTIEACGSIGNAARQLHLTQSAASQSLAALEKTLGLPLFTRSANGVTSTAFARSLFDDARMAVDAAGRIVQKAKDAETILHDRPAGFSIAAIPSIAQKQLPLWRKQLQRLFPALDIPLYQGNHLEVSDWVKNGITDAGLTALEATPQDDLSSTVLRQEELLIVAQRHDPLLRQPEFPLQDVAAQTIIMAAGSEYIMQPLFHNAGLPLPAMIRTQDIATALNMVRQGLGITIIAEKTFPQADFHDLRLRSTQPPCYRTLRLIHLPDHPQQDIIRALTNIITSHKQN